MLSKLLKYEFKATARWFLPLYIALIVLTLLNKITIAIDLPDFLLFDILEVSLIIFYVLLIIFTSVITVVLILVRFYKNMLTDEGYLTHTLPVKAGTNFNCKIISAVVWNIASFFVQALSLFLLFVGKDIFSEVGIIFGEFISYLKENDLVGSVVVTLIIFVVVLIISVFYSTLMMYCSLSVGSLFSHHKILGAIVIYFLISFIIEIVTMLFMTIGMKLPFLETIMETTNLTKDLLNFLNITMLLSALLSIIASVIFYILSNYVLSKKLNLD